MDVIKEVASLDARGRSIILSMESDRWEIRSSTLDTLSAEAVEEHVMLVLEHIEDEDKSVRCAAVDALLRLNAYRPSAMPRYYPFIALKLQKDDRPIQLLALALLEKLDAALHTTRVAKRVRRLEDDKDPAVRTAAKRVRIKCESHEQVKAQAQAQEAAVASAKAAARQLQQREEQERQVGKAKAAAPRSIRRHRVGGRLLPAGAFGWEESDACPPLPPLPGACQKRTSRRPLRRDTAEVHAEVLRAAEPPPPPAYGRGAPREVHNLRLPRLRRIS